MNDGEKSSSPPSPVRWIVAPRSWSRSASARVNPSVLRAGYGELGSPSEIEFHSAYQGATSGSIRMWSPVPILLRARAAHFTSSFVAS